jgi:hypothetical protein
LLDSLLQKVEATLPHLVLQKDKNDTEKRSKGDGVKESYKGLIRGQIAKSGRIAPRCRHRRLIADGSAKIAS